jgi:hypothetical protein
MVVLVLHMQDGLLVYITKGTELNSRPVATLLHYVTFQNISYDIPY